MRNNVDIDSLLALAEEDTTIPVVASHGGGNKYSFNVVNSKNNGKRLAFSKALSKKLSLDDSVNLVPIPTEGVLLLAKDMPFPRASKGILKGDDKKICYGADLVKLVTTSFGLNFAERTSLAFSDISFEEKDGAVIAVINMSTANGVDSVSDDAE